MKRGWILAVALMVASMAAAEAKTWTVKGREVHSGQSYESVVSELGSPASSRTTASGRIAVWRGRGHKALSKAWWVPIYGGISAAQFANARGTVYAWTCRFDQAGKLIGVSCNSQFVGPE